MADNKRSGITLLELTIILIITGILGAVMVPKYISFRKEAELAVEKQQVGVVQVGINSYFIQSVTLGRVPQFPPVLDEAANYSVSSAQNPFFGFVVANPGISKPQWKKLNSYLYQGASGNQYVYDPSQGNFNDYSGNTTAGSLLDEKSGANIQVQD